MSTQKTDVGTPPQGKQQQADPQESSASGEIDLGIPADGGPIAEDPSGYVPPHEPMEVHGRRVRPVANADLAEMHHRVAGNQPMYSQPIPKDQLADSGHAPPARGPMDQATAGDRQQAQRLMPEFLQAAGMPDQTQQHAPVHTNPNAPGANMLNQQAPQQQQPEEPANPFFEEEDDASFEGAAGALEFLLKEEQEAYRRGDEEGVMQARQMREQLAQGYAVDRKVKMKPRHPVLQKLLSNLGLEVIKPATVPWGGSDWMFASPNAKIDRWAGSEMDADRTNAIALMIASSVVGMDNAPIYEVLGVDLNVTYEISKDGREETIHLKRFRRECSCGELLAIDDAACPACKRAHDPFDIPTDLRLHCAKQLYRMLENDFGPYEELYLLLELRDKAMPNRLTERDELFPLAMPSPEVSTTDNSPSGDE